MTAEAERIAAAHGPPFVVVNGALEVVHFSARIGRFLAPAPGQASLNLLQLVPRGLRPSLSALLDHVALTGQPAQTGRLQIDTEAGRVALIVLAEPLADGPDRRFVIMFQAGSEDVDLGLAGLNTVVGEPETSRNERLSLSEDFRLVNRELADRMDELARANSDLQNVLESTRIAIIILDGSLLLQSFTPAAADVIHVQDSDLGRPLSDLPLRLDYPELMQDVQRVLRTLATIEREASAAQGRKRYLVRMLPYRRTDNFIAGVVITFSDITATFEAERGRRDSEERFRVMADIVPAFLFSTDSRGEWQYVNAPFCSFTGLAPDKALGGGWWSAVHPDDAEGVRRMWQDAVERCSELEVELRLQRSNNSRDDESHESWFLLRAVPQLDGTGAALGWLGSCIDINARLRAGRRQRQLLSELQHRVKNILAVVRSVVIRTVMSSKTVEELSAHLSGRINAIARVQSMIVRNAGNGIALSELVDEELAAHGGHVDRQTDLSGPTVLLADKAAESLGLALHELTTNAIKFGALSVPSGRLSVRWQLYPLGVDHPQEQRLVLDWQESGVPVTDLQPGHSGFGRELLETGLPYELDAATTLDFRPGGVRWVIQLVVAEPSHGRAAVSE